MRSSIGNTQINIVKARGEAEAELAILNRDGYIDGIMTDDVDALAFGAKRIVRKYVFSHHRIVINA